MRKQASARQRDSVRLLESRDKPLKADQIREMLRTNEPGIAPPTMYRTRSALTDQGCAHRLEPLKTYVPCRCGHSDTLPVLAVFEGCCSVEEHDGGALLPALATFGSNSAFRTERHVLDIHGHCQTCAA